MKENNKQPSKEKYYFGIIGFLLGLLIAWSVSIYAVNGNHQSMMRRLNMHNSMIDSMNDRPGACSSTQCSGE